MNRAKTLGLCLLLSGTFAASSRGEEPNRPENHTVSWYVAHPAAMRAQMAACKDDPGHARNVPNCYNADQAQLVLATEDAQSHADASALGHRDYEARHPSVTSPAPPMVLPVPRQEEIQFWSEHKQEMLAKMQTCHNISRQEFMHRCASVFASAQVLVSR